MGDRLRFLPASVALGLFVGDLLTLALTDGVTIRRVAVSAAVALVAYYLAAWWTGRRRG